MHWKHKCKLFETVFCLENWFSSLYFKFFPIFISMLNREFKKITKKKPSAVTYVSKVIKMQQNFNTFLINLVNIGWKIVRMNAKEKIVLFKIRINSEHNEEKLNSNIWVDGRLPENKNIELLSNKQKKNAKLCG